MGDDGFRAFFEHEWFGVVRTLGLMTDDTRYLEDAAQKAFLRARHRWLVIRLYDKPGAWVLKVAVRDLRRWQSRDLVRHQPMIEEDDREDEQACDLYARADEQRDIATALGCLPPRQRECVVLYYLRDLPIAQVADILGVAEGTVKAQLSAGRARLQQVLAPHGEEGSTDGRR